MKIQGRFRMEDRLANAQLHCSSHSAETFSKWNAFESKLSSMARAKAGLGAGHALKESHEQSTLNGLCSVHREPEARVGVGVLVSVWSFLPGKETCLELRCCFWS